MIENKENGDSETWADIRNIFNETFNYWIYEFDKTLLSIPHILLVQEAFSVCFTVLQRKKKERDYVLFSQNIELLRIVLLTKTSNHPVYRRALREIHHKYDYFLLKNPFFKALQFFKDTYYHSF